MVKVGEISSKNYHIILWMSYLYDFFYLIIVMIIILINLFEKTHNEVFYLILCNYFIL